jgi:hypothetical protein
MIQRVLIHPVVEIVLGFFRVPAAEQAVQIFRVFEIVIDDQRSVGVLQNVLVEVAVV